MELNKKQKREIILTVALDEMGLSIELGDLGVDGKIRGYHPTEEFIEALSNEVDYHISNTIRDYKLSRKILERFEKGLMVSV